MVLLMDTRRIVAKGYNQMYGIDNEERFSPIATINTRCIPFSLATLFGWELHPFDVKNAFLLEKVYMETPLGFALQVEETWGIG